MSKRKDNEIDFEIQFYENLLKKKPDFPEALAALGDLYTKRGMFEKGLEIDKRLVKIKPDDPIVQYNLACSYSLMNDTDKALSSIKKAIICGYDDFRHLERDGDLDNLRKDKRFRQYLSRVKYQRALKKGNKIK